MSRYKFDDCSECRFRRKPMICRECDYGEQFESADMGELRFDDAHSFNRASKSLITEDDEPHFNPDDLIERLDAQEENSDEDE